MNKLLLALLVAVTFSASSQNIAFRSLYPLSPGETTAGVWGHVDSLGNEYALVGGSKGLYIVNVTNPDSVFLVKFVDGPDNLWKEIRTWGGFAYVTTESSASPGLQIVDLRNLPDTNLAVKYWSPTINGTQLVSIHALEISSGYAYLYGSNVGGQGAVIANLSDPWNPAYAGSYDAGGYIHDGYVRNDTLYAGHIYAGMFAIVDVSDKTNPVQVATQQTPNNFTHNTWLSDDSKFLFTTDEVNNSYLTAYDIRDKQNIKETDRIQATPGSGSMVHNVLVKDDYAVVSWYKDGIVIVDAHRPENLVFVGMYDTYPAGSGGGVSGAWSVYPFLPSGTILSGSIGEGLYVLTPTYKRASYFEGVVTDSICGGGIDDVSITLNSVLLDKTILNGSYKTGYYNPGTYNVTFSKAGYTSRTVSITLDTGVVKTLNVSLFSSQSVAMDGSLKADTGATALVNADVMMITNGDTLNFTTDSNGEFDACMLFSNYTTFGAAKWGFKELCMDSVMISSASSQVDLVTERGYEDVFNFDQGWTVSSSTGAIGTWTRTSAPIGFPNTDITTDCGTSLYVTGNAATLQDLDLGNTTLTTPAMDLLGMYDDPTISYYRYINLASTVDTFRVTLTNGVETDTLETVTTTAPVWTQKTFRVKDYMALTNNMKVSFYAVDAGTDNRVEAGIDGFEVLGQIVFSTPELAGLDVAVYPNPFSDSFTVNWKSDEVLSAAVYDISGKEIELTAIRTGSSINFSGQLSKGIYFVKVFTKNGVVTKKLMKQ